MLAASMKDFMILTMWEGRVHGLRSQRYVPSTNPKNLGCCIAATRLSSANTIPFALSFSFWLATRRHALLLHGCCSDKQLMPRRVRHCIDALHHCYCFPAAVLAVSSPLVSCSCSGTASGTSAAPLSARNDCLMLSLLTAMLRILSIVVWSWVVPPPPAVRHACSLSARAARC